jgi:trans-2,3-dihydro-3-hydroxyanthranilate isomerase
MNPHTFYIVDVFAEKRFQGNQLAVLTDASDLSGEEMQAIAREMNYAETTFILSDDEHDGGFDVRIFTPAREVPFAGHPTLGTAHVLAGEILGRPVSCVRLNLAIGQIPVKFREDPSRGLVLWMRQQQPEFGPVADPCDLAEVLGLREEDFDNQFPIQEVSTGLAFTIVSLRTLDAVQRACINRQAYTQFIHDREAKAIFIFCPETVYPDHDLHARMFADFFGVSEDPATGSAAGCLAAYLVRHRYYGSSSVQVQVEQGYEIQRPSLLFLDASEREGIYEVNVGGRVIPVARGRIG